MIERIRVFVGVSGHSVCGNVGGWSGLVGNK